MSSDDLVPLRGVNAVTFCPRLYWLEYVAGEFADNEHTIEGQSIHRRVDRPGGSMPAPEGDDGDGGPSWNTRSLWLSDPELGVTGKIDLVEPEDRDGFVIPVDTKKGKPPGGGELWPADRVQLTLQALLLRAQGYQVEEMAVWYHSARKRVKVPVTTNAISEAREAIRKARRWSESERPPDPLVDSPKCEGCSLNVICLPDEVNAVGRDHLSRSTNGGTSAEVRRVFPARDDALPLYVDTPGRRVGLSKDSLVVKPRRGSDQEKETVGLGRISQVNLMGGVQISTQALQACLRNEIPVGFFSTGGWFYGRTVGMSRSGVLARRAQFSTAGTPAALAISRTVVADKISNARTLLRRNARSEDVDNLSDALDELARLRSEAGTVKSIASLLGVEGSAARLYWNVYGKMLARDDEAFSMAGRSRRPPEDPANALLSYGYSLLTKDCTLAVSGAGLDPQLGMFHQPHHNQPALGLDLMEPFRPLIVDSMVLQMVRRGEAQSGDFVRTGQAVAMKDGLRKKLIRAYERRMDELVTHPVFGYRISYRRILSVQARLLSRVFTGEIDEMVSFRTR